MSSSRFEMDTSYVACLGAAAAVVTRIHDQLGFILSAHHIDKVNPNGQYSYEGRPALIFCQQCFLTLGLHNASSSKGRYAVRSQIAYP
jgi:hypothetical protein